MIALGVLMGLTLLGAHLLIRCASATDAGRQQTAEAYAAAYGLVFVMWFGAAFWLLVDIAQRVMA